MANDQNRAADTTSNSDDSHPTDHSRPTHITSHLGVPQRKSGRLRQQRGAFTSSSESTTRRAGRSPKNKKARPAQTEEPMWPTIINDSWRVFNAILRLYPIWKWLFLVYLSWLTLSYSTVAIYRFTMSNLKPICAIPILGPSIQMCSPVKDYNRQINVSKVTDSQQGLTEVMGYVGPSFEVATSIVYHEFAVRDLRIRVSASRLSRARELTEELVALSRQTKLTAKGLSHFTAKTRKTIDIVATFDNYAARKLQDIAQRRKTSLSLPTRILRAIQPFGAWHLMDVGQTEKRVRDVFITTAKCMRKKVGILLEDTSQLFDNLENINMVLDHIKELCQEELGDVPTMNVLSALWNMLARADDYDDYKSHVMLLEDIIQFYNGARYAMQHIQAALNRMESELNEFGEDFAGPGLILKDYPLEVMVEMLKKAGRRLEDGQHGLKIIRKMKL